MEKDKLIKSALAGLFSAITIGALTYLTYKTTFGLFLIASFGSTMVLLYGYPESPFAQPKNIFFGHLVTAVVGSSFKFYTTSNLYHYSNSGWFRSWFNDFFRCHASTSRRKPNYSHYWKCLL